MRNQYLHIPKKRKNTANGPKKLAIPHGSRGQKLILFTSMRARRIGVSIKTNNVDAPNHLCGFSSNEPIVFKPSPDHMLTNPLRPVSWNMSRLPQYHKLELMEVAGGAALGVDFGCTGGGYHCGS